MMRDMLHASVGSQQGCQRHWKFLNLDERPWDDFVSFLSSKLDQLQQAGDSANLEAMATEDPIGVLATLGVLCVPITQTVDKDVEDVDYLTHQAQQRFSVAILEEPEILEEPTIAAQSYVRWAIAAVADITGHCAFDFDALFEGPQGLPRSPSTVSTASDFNSECSAITHVHHLDNKSP
jgi:hypothetical protein